MMKRVWSITFHVSNLKRAVDFYEHTLGLDKKYEFLTYAGFECGGVELGLNLRTEETTTGETPVIDFLVDNVDDICRALKEQGVTFVKDVHDEPWGGRHATFTDPDGHLLEVLQIDWKKYFDSATTGFEKHEQRTH